MVTVQAVGKEVTSHSIEEAVLNSDLVWIENAIAQGLDVNIPTSDGKVPLVLASAAGQLEVGHPNHSLYKTVLCFLAKHYGLPI